MIRATSGTIDARVTLDETLTCNSARFLVIFFFFCGFVVSALFRNAVLSHIISKDKIFIKVAANLPEAATVILPRSTSLVSDHLLRLFDHKNRIRFSRAINYNQFDVARDTLHTHAIAAICANDYLARAGTGYKQEGERGHNCGKGFHCDSILICSTITFAISGSGILPKLLIT
jgi:hypothetical protein